MNYTLDFMKEILAIPSIAGDCCAAMDRTEEELKKLGLTTSRTNKGCVVAEWKAKGVAPTGNAPTGVAPARMISAHIDTLGAVVREIKKNGRMSMFQVGGFAWPSVEGAEVTLKASSGKTYSGTIMFEKSSVHAWSDEARAQRTDETMELRIDEDTTSKDETMALGVRAGDFIFFEPSPRVTESGFVKSRFLDDKLCVALMLGTIKRMKEANLTPSHTTYFYISNYEELGHGVSFFPAGVTEFAALDIGIVSEHNSSDEHAVSIAARDNRTPYDLKFRRRLEKLANDNGINYRTDAFYRYGSDASVAVLAGFDVNFACFGPAVDASHHIERTHKDGIKSTMDLLQAYLLEA